MATLLLVPVMFALVHSRRQSHTLPDRATETSVSDSPPRTDPV
jgi:hypothetical protein